MGLFGSSSQTIVSSVVYNLAGDVAKRPNFLKTALASAILGDSPSIPQSITSSYLNGPGLRLKTFSSWAAKNYTNVVGVTAGNIVTGNSLKNDVLATQIPALAGYTVEIESSDLGIADISWWAEQYILTNHPDRIQTHWHADYLNGQCVITYVDGTKDTFTPAGFNPDAKYIFAGYTLNTGKAAGPVVTGNVVSLGSTAFPDTSDWTLDSQTMAQKTINLTTHIHTQSNFSDGRASIVGPTTDIVNAALVVETHTVFEKTDYKGIDPANVTRTHSLRSVMYQDQTASSVAGTAVAVEAARQTLPDGVLQVDYTITAADQLVFSRTYRTDTQDVTNSTTSAMQIFIYPQGGGNATLDAMFAAPANIGTFLPYIPIRIDNKMLSTTYQPDIYAAAKKAYKKATGGKFDDLVDSINTNKSIGDIDYAYVVFGVSLNTTELTAKEYMFKFFETMMLSASFTPHAYSQFKTQWAKAQASQDAFGKWLGTNGGFGQPVGAAPAVTPYPSLPVQAIGMQTDHKTNLNYEIQVLWNGIEKTIGAGILDAAHKVGDIWWTVNGADQFDQLFYVSQDPSIGGFTNSFKVNHVTLNWQVDDNNWKQLSIYGLLHKNLIYNGMAVETSVIDAINDTGESPFIIPLHEEIFKSTSMVDSTQLSTACCYLVFNCYQVVKKKWYQTGLFSIILIVVVIVITIYSGGFGATSAGLLGTNAAVGASLGFAGAAAAIVGAVANAIAAIILMKTIGLVSTAAFGDKVGAIIGAVASLVAITVGTAYMNGANFSTALTQLTSPKNILQLTSAVGKGYTQYLGAETQDIINQTEQVSADYNTQSKTISDLFDQNVANLSGVDSSALTDAASQQYQAESPSSFLSRTLMTGSDISELDSQLISQFTSLTLDTSQNLVT